MLNNIISIFVICSLFSCTASKSVENVDLDEKFDLCSKVKYEKLINKVAINDSQQAYAENIHGHLENFLLIKGYLSNVSASGYEKLLIAVSDSPERFSDFEEFKSELGFDPLFLFASNYQASCYDYVIDQLKLVKSDSWQHQFREYFWKAEATGFFEDTEHNIIKALRIIPKEKFNSIVYRKLFLDLIYWKLNN